MDGSRLPSMRAGLGGVVAEDSSPEVAQNFIRTSMGLLRVFSEEAVKTAGEYAVAHERVAVSNEDMSKALKYQARMFFQQVAELDGRVDEAARELLAGSDEDGGSNEESGSEDEEDSEVDSEEENVAAADEDASCEAEAPSAEDDETGSVSGNSVSTSNSRSTVSTVSASSLASSVIAGAMGSASAQSDEPSDIITDAERAHCRGVARRVDAIVASWAVYEPTDPILVMIKNAIDATDRRPRREVEEAEGQTSGKRARMQ